MTQPFNRLIFAILIAPAAAPVTEVIQGPTTYSEGPTQVVQYHYQSQQRIPTQEVKVFQTHSAQAKKIIYNHNQHEKVSLCPLKWLFYFHIKTCM